MVGQLATREGSQVAHALFEELRLELDQGVGDLAQRLPPLTQAIDEESRAGNVVADVGAFAVAQGNRRLLPNGRESRARRRPD